MSQVIEAKAKMIRILLVEDSKFLRLATERALARAGYEVCSAADGDEALLLARQKLPDLILLDMLLPKMSGPDVLKALKQDPATKSIAVVAMTGMSEKNAARLRQGGGIAFLEKSALEPDNGPAKMSAALRGTPAHPPNHATFPAHRTKQAAPWSPPSGYPG